MFGPDAESVFNRNILVCDCGSSQAVTKVTSLFDGAGAKIITIPVRKASDKLMSYVLGLSHAVNIAFFRTLSKTGVAYDRLEQHIVHNLPQPGGDVETGGQRKPRPLLRITPQPL